jgi:hypothetical protein
MTAKGKRKIDWHPRMIDWCQYKENGNLISGRLRKGVAGYTK